MKSISVTLLLATLALASCGDSGENTAASLAASTSAAATTRTPAPNTPQRVTTSQPATTTTTTQTPTTTNMTVAGDASAEAAAELPEILVKFYEAVLAGDATAMAALFAEDGGLTGPRESQIRGNLSTPSEIQYMMSIWFTYVDNTTVEPLHVITDANNVVVVSRMGGMSATHQRSSKTPFSAIVVDVFELRDGLIARCDVYFEYGEIVT